MRQSCLVLTALFAMAAPAPAQVTVDLQALDQVPHARPAQKAPTRHTARKSAPSRVAKSKPAEPTAPAAASTPAPAVATAAPPPAAAAPAAPAAPAPPAATLPTAPPPTIALAPVVPAPAPPEPAAAPPQPPVSEAATSAASATGAGLRVTFGAGEAELSPASADAIKNVVRSAPPGDNTSFNVVAYAAGTPEDPSTARRLSLSRALAVRSALMAQGVSSTRIYVRALGAAGGNDAPDRVDLAVMGANAASPDASAKNQSQ
jgi:outer membrane protein OmpA-like peptidoglycan-associated protein